MLNNSPCDQRAFKSFQGKQVQISEEKSYFTGENCVFAGIGVWVGSV